MSFLVLGGDSSIQEVPTPDQPTVVFCMRPFTLQFTALEIYSVLYYMMLTVPCDGFTLYSTVLLGLVFENVLLW